MIAKMERLEIVCMREAMPGVVGFLQDQGLLHVEEVPLAQDAAPGFLKRVALEPSQQQKADALETQHRTLNEVIPLLSAKPLPQYVTAAGNSLKSKTDQELEEMARGWVRELRALTRRRLNVQDNLEVLSSFKKTLESIAPLLGGRPVVLGKDARAFVLKGDVARGLERLEERRKGEIGADSRLFSHKVSRNVVAGVLTYPASRNEIVARIFKEELIPPVELPEKDLRGASIQEVIQKLDLAIAKHKSSGQELEGRLFNYSKEIGAELLAYEAKISDELSQLTSMGSFAQSAMVGVIHGWAPSDMVGTLTARIENKFPGQVLVSHLPIDKIDVHEIPTFLRNHQLLKPFETLLMIFKPPTYGTIDPTGLVAISFVIFYGFILGDVGYAAVVALFGLFMKRKFGHIDILSNIGTVAYWMAASSAVFGVVFGEYFGDLGHKLLHLPVFFHRGHDVTTLMLCAIAFGAIHIPLALVLGIWADFSHHHAKHAAEKLGLLLGLIAIGIFAMQFFKVAPFTAFPFTIVAVALVVIFLGLLVWASGAMAPVLALEVVSLLGNVLSYCRLMALGLAGVLIADLANQTAHGVGLIIGIPLALLIHTFNIGLSMFSPTIHSLRLNYVEFLPKFYRPEGRSYQPFKKEALW
ncbi:MAG: hypothetical protein K1Y02_07925 [Candidatus Hydrogenedentes bacterium]|nr:hypothetical protein [Candidatus Hydrogenedentota bacterium]